jgi:hypothetical protein
MEGKSIDTPATEALRELAPSIKVAAVKGFSFPATRQWR